MLERSRPVSPFLHYRWQYTNALSLLHRVTGILLSIGYLLLVYWVIAMACGPAAYAHAAILLSNPLAQGLLAFVGVAFAYHLCNGIRHLVWDAGLGLERRAARRSAWVVVLVTILLSILVGSIVFIRRGGLS